MTVAPEARAIGQVHQIFVGTTRAAEPDGQFSSHRSESLSFARVDISIPPDHEPGKITWPPRNGKADPTRHFLTAGNVLYSNATGFNKALRAELKAKGGEAVIFVHGFNNNYAEGLYRLAQFSNDLKLPGAVISYSWPSAANPLGYVYDRDSALFARDGLEELMGAVADAGATSILLVAHSMGASLTMEALRQAAIRGNSKAMGRLAGVVLISPDIDVDVFRLQALAIGKLPQPFVIFGSDRDKVLKFSARLTGQSERLGSISDVTRLADLDVTFLDVSAFAAGDKHFAAAESPALILLLSRIGDINSAFEQDRVSRIGLIPGAVLTVQNATQIILRPIGALGVNAAQ